jgi:hypothetical protein
MNSSVVIGIAPRLRPQGNAPRLRQATIPSLLGLQPLDSRVPLAVCMTVHDRVLIKLFNKNRYLSIKSTYSRDTWSGFCRLSSLATPERIPGDRGI